MITPVHLLRKIVRKKGFTLVEIILASTIFTIVSVIGVSVFVNVTRIQRRVILENAMYEDGRFMMERIAREIRQNSVDYEEYYNKLVEKKQYGAEYGCYASRFYNPGSEGPGGFGGKCSIPADGDPALNPGCVMNKTTLDINTGQHPFTGSGFGNISTANALCDEHFDTTSNNGDCVLTTLHEQNELFLIDAKGEQKTILALKKVNNSPLENSLGLLRIQGKDANTDGIFEKWVDPGTDYYCAPGYDCNVANFEPDDELEVSLDGSIPSKRYEGFVPISPLRTNITSLKFYISPVEDPRKAFAETDIVPPSPVIQQQPHVTVVMTLQPAANELINFSGNIPTITLQNTISSRVYNEVKSYMGTDSFCSTGYT